MKSLAIALGSAACLLAAVQASGALDPNPPTVPVLPTVTVGLRKASGIEGGHGAQAKAAFAVRRDGDLSKELKVFFGIAGTAEDGTDYRISAVDSVTIPIGQDRVCVIVDILDDGKAEGDETVDLTLLDSPDYQIGNPSGNTVTIQDNDQTPPANEGDAGVGGA